MTVQRRTVTLVVMGVSGVGKTSVATELATRLGGESAEGDDFHSVLNRKKMADGHPLDDEDRWPWLRSIAEWIGRQEDAGRSSVVTCSALKRTYRDLLADGHPSVRFVHLKAPPGVIADRVQARQGHYMPPSLLESQLVTLEPLQPEEAGFVVETTGEPPAVAEEVLRRLEEEGHGQAGPAVGS